MLKLELVTHYAYTLRAHTVGSLRRTNAYAYCILMDTKTVFNVRLYDRSQCDKVYSPCIKHATVLLADPTEIQNYES
jgi:hypothetical protein